MYIVRENDNEAPEHCHDCGCPIWDPALDDKRKAVYNDIIRWLCSSCLWGLLVNP
jgi:hypothetical protein